MADQSPKNETELESLCLRFLQEAGRVPPDSAALGRAISPLVPVIKDWVRKRLRRQGNIPTGARGWASPEDVAAEVLLRLQKKPPTDHELTGKAFVRLHSWVNKTTINLMRDIARKPSRCEQPCGTVDHIGQAPGDAGLEPENLLDPGPIPTNLEELMDTVFVDLLSTNQLALLRLELGNARSQPMRTDAALAEELGVSLDNLYQLRRRYLLKLREWWEKNRDFYP